MLGACLLMVSNVSAQQSLLNGDFNNWEALNDVENPSGWFTLNPLTIFGYEPSTTKVSGNNGGYAVRLVSIANNFQNIPGLLCTGPLLNKRNEPDFTKMRVPFSGQPASFNFSYKYYPVNNDSCLAYMMLTKWNDVNAKTDTIAMARIILSDTVQEFTNKIVFFEYYSQAIADSMQIFFSSSIDGFNPNVGSELIIDDLYIVRPSGEKELLLSNLNSLYPNPFKDEINISNFAEDVSYISVYNLRGEMLFEQINPKGAINLSFLSEGVYLARLNTKNTIITTRIIKNN